MYYYLTEVSRNPKTGPIPVATSSKHTCPTSCPLIGEGGCYGETGPVAIHWNAVTAGERGMSFDEFLKAVEKLRRGQIWRYGQVGDLPGEGDIIDVDQLKSLAKANRNKPVIAFTHKPPVGSNLEALKAADENGFQINLSADNPTEADEFADTGLPVVVVLPSEYGRLHAKGEWTETVRQYRERTKHLPKKTSKNRKIAVCPNTYLDTTCDLCRVCSHKRQGVIVGFPAHGTRKGKIDVQYKV